MTKIQFLKRAFVIFGLCVSEVVLAAGKTKAHLQLSHVGQLTPPRLILALVIDQFRADLLLRYQRHFRKNGFQLLLDKGAIYPFAQYPVLQNLTCPGHAMILTGSTPSANGIILNDWFDPQTKKNVYCVDDVEFKASPRRLQGSTLSDQLKLRWPTSKSVGVALKDRAAIMLVGRSADAAYWYDFETGWGTSSYYTKASPQLKNWKIEGSPKKDEMLVWKNTLGSRIFSSNVKWGTAQGIAHPITLGHTLKMAQAAFEAHELGQDEVPDLLAISLSTHDLAGHQFGPDSPELEDMILNEDRVLSELFTWLGKKVPGGLANVWVLLTADHGVAPLTETSSALGLDAGRLEIKSSLQSLNQEIKERFSACRNGDWIIGHSSLHFYWDSECLMTARTQRKEVERFAKDQMLKWNGIAAVFTRADYDSALLPANYESAIKKSYVAGLSGDIVIIPKPFWYPEGPPATHITNYTYDKTVPLILMGAPFKPGVYAQKAEVIDAAPTLAHSLRILAPALSSGRVLNECLLPEKL